MKSLMSCSSLAGVWIRLRALMEDHAQHVVARPQLGEDLAVVGFERGSRPAQQRLPVVLDGHHPLAAQQLVLLVGHLQEQQVGELLQVVAVGQPVVAQHVAEVPQSLHERLGVVTGIISRYAAGTAVAWRLTAVRPGLGHRTSIPVESPARA